jgi:hypothetical protein
MSGISPQQKKDSREREREREDQGLKRKRGEISVEKVHVLRKKRERGWNLQVAGRDSIKRKKERRSQFTILQNPMCGLVHTHTSFAFALPPIPWLFPFLPPFTTPFTINHDYLPHKLSRVFLCIYNIQRVAYVPLESEPP